MAVHCAEQTETTDVAPSRCGQFHAAPLLMPPCRSPTRPATCAVAARLSPPSSSRALRPAPVPQDALVKIAKKLKKNNVAVDIVSFGCEEENGEKLEAFHAAVNSNDNSHLVTVPPGTILSDMLFGTPIFMEEGAGGDGAGAGEGGAPAPRSECRAALPACLAKHAWPLPSAISVGTATPNSISGQALPAAPALLPSTPRILCAMHRHTCIHTCAPCRQRGRRL